MFSSNSRPLPQRTYSVNAAKHANYFSSIDEELRDCKRVLRQGQEEDLREALSRMMAKVEEMVRYHWNIALPHHAVQHQVVLIDPPPSVRRSNRLIKRPRILRPSSRWPNRISSLHSRITRCSRMHSDLAHFPRTLVGAARRATLVLCSPFRPLLRQRRRLRRHNSSNTRRALTRVRRRAYSTRRALIQIAIAHRHLLLHPKVIRASSGSASRLVDDLRQRNLFLPHRPRGRHGRSGHHIPWEATLHPHRCRHLSHHHQLRHHYQQYQHQHHSLPPTMSLRNCANSFRSRSASLRSSRVRRAN